MISADLSDLLFFNGLTEEELQRLSPFFTHKSFKARQVIFKQDAIAEFLYLLCEGSVVIRFKPDDGPVMKVAQIHTGGVFGWSAAMGNVSYTSSAKCLEDCKTLKISGSDLQKLCNTYPDLGKIISDRLAAVISERWQNRQTQVISLISRCIYQPEGGMMDVIETRKFDSNEMKIKEEQMKGLVEQLSAYIEHFHGGSVEYVSFDGKKLYVRLGGACLGCPLSPATLHGWVAGTVRQFFPDIEIVEAV
ncbi:MAG: cyclic nucleotide-binding domain-containing protein [Chloroflexota bacterium]